VTRQWRRGSGRGAGLRTGRVVLAGAAALCVMAVLPGQAWAAGAPGSYAYAFQPGAEQVSGAGTTSEAKGLESGATYRDAIKPGGKLFYRVDLDAKTNAYVSAVAVPVPGTKVAFGDKIEVSLQSRDGTDCSSDSESFGSGEFARPIAAYAFRESGKADYASCQDAGSYYVVIERTSDEASDPGPWELEIRDVLEPGLRKAGPTEAPTNWPSASPEPLTDNPAARAGGAGFYDAAELRKGQWSAKIKPGESLFYRVPVDWGQQLFTSVDLGSSDGSGFVGSALSMALYNPALGLVDSGNSVLYDGKQKTTSIPPLPPVAYENRFDFSDAQRGMRFAGSYYVRISLSPKVGEVFGEKAYGLTLQVNVSGSPKGGPAYAGDPGIFDVSGHGLLGPGGAGGAGGTGGGAGDGTGVGGVDGVSDGTMRLVAVSGIGAGTVLVLGLGAWTLLARRRGARGAGGPQGPGGPQGSGGPQGPGQYRPPSAW
jgi:hypothetical protein